MILFEKKTNEMRLQRQRQRKLFNKLIVMHTIKMTVEGCNFFVFHVEKQQKIAYSRDNESQASIATHRYRLCSMHTLHTYY